LKILYHKNFLKDLASIPLKQRTKIEDFAFAQITKATSLQSIGNVEKLKGRNHYYKIRFGDYRVGLHFQADVLTFERVLHRKEIYRFYP
jgi:mRNA interferase RelE/StbE